MRRWKLLVLAIFPLSFAFSAHAEDAMVYTAHQDWPSRIYVLRMDGTIVNCFEYWYYRFVDTELVNNELYGSLTPQKAREILKKLRSQKLHGKDHDI